ncbi:CD99 antigen-like protein 2 isoform X2 [Cynoglossus semilaevis]|uniref:CD99 antigen-like protein 2 isoform X2 n=1 Tax=Cynoglossus semilaevis TaxID=244447 RepID=UPI000D62E7C6|nr:CD99 antigen-like protein 2 isoform X2 [Cynoglossus semilaevis]
MANCFSMGTVRGSVLPLLLLFLLLPPLQVLSQDAFDLSDALSDDDSKPASPTPKDKKAGGGATGGDFDLSDLFKDSHTTTAKPKSKPDPKVPKSTTAPAKPKPKPGDDLSLADALDPINDINRKDKDKGQGGG